MRAEQLDHVVLTVADIDFPTALGARPLGMTPVAKGGRYAERSLDLPERHRNLIEIAVYETGHAEESIAA